MGAKQPCGLLVLLAGLSACLVAAGCGAGVRSGAAPGSGQPRLPALPLFGIVGAGPLSARLYAIDPRTLRARRGRSAALDGHTSGWSFAPDHRLLALGSDSTAELRLVDLRRLRSLGDVELTPRGGLVYATGWADRQRVLAAVVTPGCCGLGDTIIAAVDAHSRRVLWRRDLRGSLQAGARYQGGFVLVVGPAYALGRSRLLLVAPSGHIRTALLARIRSGWQRSRGRQRFVSYQWNPGLALDAAGGRAFVVQAGAPVAEIDLRSLAVRYHDLTEPISLLGRLHNWLEPKARAKAMDGPHRQAVWLGSNRLAVSGVDYHASRDAQGNQQEVDAPAGLKLIDIRRWSIRTLDQKISSLTLTNGILFAYGASWDSRTSSFGGAGLTAYDSNGQQLYHRYQREPISNLEAVPDGVLVAGTQGSSVFRTGAVLEPQSGHLRGHAHFDLTLLSGDESFWF